VAAPVVHDGSAAAAAVAAAGGKHPSTFLFLRQIFVDEEKANSEELKTVIERDKQVMQASFE
jgi:hypothetical protein